MDWTFFKKYLPKVGTQPQVTEFGQSKFADSFALQWKRGPLLNDRDSAMSYYVSSRQFLKYSLSGPLPTIARPFRLAAPSPPQQQRRFPNWGTTPAGIINGQTYSQPLYDANAGGFTQGMYEPNNAPFERNGQSDPTIQPAGAA